jgi:hypothetical protein
MSGNPPPRRDDEVGRKYHSTGCLTTKIRGGLTTGFASAAAARQGLERAQERGPCKDAQMGIGRYSGGGQPPRFPPLRQLVWDLAAHL